MTLHGGNGTRQNRVVSERAKTTARAKAKAKAEPKPKMTSKFLEKKGSALTARTHRAASNTSTARVRTDHIKENQAEKRRTRKDRKKP